jgi:tetratricopeptide (TPR) repeat protein
LASVRWARIDACLEAADVRGAKADAEHLEAAASGSYARHAVWTRVADAFAARGHLVDAASLFERALRYAPDSPEAVAGLARSLRAVGQDRRALDLLARAAALAERAGRQTHAVELDLARGLAEIASDLPSAVARVRAIPPGVPEAFEARLLEGRWRAALGDFAGASIALGRLRDAVELVPSARGDVALTLAGLMAEAAEIEEKERGDLLAALRHLGVAIRLAPRNRTLAAAFRRVSEEVEQSGRRPDARTVATPAGDDSFAAEEMRGDEVAAGSAPLDDGYAADTDTPPELSERDLEDEALVERLTNRVRADPGDHAAAVELSDALTRLGRDLDLLALLSARIEEGSDEARRDFEPRRRAVLARLARTAREAGRVSEAELYEMMLRSDDS